MRRNIEVAGLRLLWPGRRAKERRSFAAARAIAASPFRESTVARFPPLRIKSRSQGACMLYSTARVLQFIGLVILPVAISGNVANSLTLGQSLTLSSIGLGVFVTGWLLQQMTRPK
jgi:hypothetical protein